jgi:hypothetical protein
MIVKKSVLLALLVTFFSAVLYASNSPSTERPGKRSQDEIVAAEVVNKPGEATKTSNPQSSKKTTDKRDFFRKH